MWQSIKNLYHYAHALLAAMYFHFPSKDITVIGVTGTDGKTTTVNMISHILKASGLKISSLTSIGAQIGSKTLNTGLHITTPSPWQTQRLLRKAVNSGSEYFVLEATSHGLDQNRLEFIKFNTAVITNITHEHIDYHKNLNNYLKAKAKLFKRVKNSIINIDDSFATRLMQLASGKITTYSLLKNADINTQSFKIKLKLVGEYNLKNALAAAACASVLGVSKQSILHGLTTFEGVAGRLQEVKSKVPYQTIVDFAHTPNALKEVLTTLRQNLRKGSRLIAVFGAAGERDKIKRPLMGKVAAELADLTIVTSEDPRRENPKKIVDQIKQGLLSHGKQEGRDFLIILDRKKAIEEAIKMAKVGDIVGFFGKGHEKSMAFGKKEYFWDEVREVRAAIQKYGKNKQ